MATADVWKLNSCNLLVAQIDSISLHTADTSNGGSEVTGGGYARKTPSWNSAAIVVGGSDNGKARSAANPLQFNVPGGVAVTHYGVWKAGVFQYAKPLTPGSTLNANGVVEVTPTHVYDLP